MGKTALLQIEHLFKRYTDNEVLRDISLEIPKSAIVGIVGENGAGKSTLLKIIMGVEKPSAGDMTVNGTPYRPSGPSDAARHGLGMVFQEQSLILNLTVGQNICLGNERAYTRFGVTNWKKAYADAEKYMNSIGIHGISPKKKVFELNFARRQMVETTRVFQNVARSGRENSLILLDEPTSVLNNEETQSLFNQIRRLKEQGHSTIFVSHRLNEVIEICDFIYVFKDGRLIGRVEKEDMSESLLYEMMVGESSPTEYYQTSLQTAPSEQVLLEAEDLGVKGLFRGVSFKLYEGEILGICGVTGSGKEDLCAVLCGDMEATSGQVRVKGHAQRFSEPYQALQQSILCIPKERKEEAVIEIQSIEDNIVLSNYKNCLSFGFLSLKKIKQRAVHWISLLGIKCTSEKDKLEQLSGGNAQKVVFARALESGANILILNHPTRGVDIGAKVEIYKMMRRAAAQGIAIVLLGDTLEESIGLSNRIFVMKDGVFEKELSAEAGKKPSKLDVVSYMM